MIVYLRKATGSFIIDSDIPKCHGEYFIKSKANAVKLFRQEFNLHRKPFTLIEIGKALGMQQVSATRANAIKKAIDSLVLELPQDEALTTVNAILQYTEGIRNQLSNKR